jgi:hypothetical protein
LVSVKRSSLRIRSPRAHVLLRPTDTCQLHEYRSKAGRTSYKRRFALLLAGHSILAFGPALEEGAKIPLQEFWA